MSRFLHTLFTFLAWTLPLRAEKLDNRSNKLAVLPSDSKTQKSPYKPGDIIIDNKEALADYDEYLFISGKSNHIGNGKRHHGGKKAKDKSGSDDSLYGTQDEASHGLDDKNIAWAPLPLAPLPKLKRATKKQTPPRMFLGDYPYCSALPIDCKVFDFSGGKDKKGSLAMGCYGSKKNKTRVYCEAAEKTKTLRLKKTKSHKFEIGTYNINEQPFEKGHEGQVERTCRIPYRLISKVKSLDAIVITDAKMGGCWAQNITLRDLFKHLGYRYNTKSVGEEGNNGRLQHVQARPLSGGIFIVSKNYILKKKIYVFKAGNPKKSKTKTGIVYIKTKKKTGSKLRNYHIFGTQLRAQTKRKTYDSVRIRQAREIQKFIERQKIPPKEPVIIAGDFNADRLERRSHVKKLFGIIGAKILAVHKKSHAYTTNNMDKPGKSKSYWLDYIAYHKSYKKPIFSVMRAYKVVPKKPFPVCVSSSFTIYSFPNAITCSNTRAMGELSNHYPVAAKFEFQWA